jgi:type III pantothenate kinase
VWPLENPEELPLPCDVVEPRRVGIDRLLNGVAAVRRLQPGEPAVLIDAGSAVTVDWLDERHTYRGGTIFPGLRLMAEALHGYTAFLPLVTVSDPIPDLPAKDTRPAMEAGIFHAVAGGIERIASLLAENSATPPRVFLTGGDAPMLACRLGFSCILWPEMTLEGILASAEALPE